MNKDDAYIHFPIDDIDDIDEIDDLYEELLFKQKQFFLSRVPVSKLFNSKLDRLVKMEKGYLFFGGKLTKKQTKNLTINFDYSSDEIYACFKQFQDNTTKLKLVVNQASNVKELSEAIQMLFVNYTNYAKKWVFNNQYDSSQVVLTKQTDEMELLKEISDLNRGGIVNFSQLNELEEANILVQESIRLSLWLNLESNA